MRPVKRAINPKSDLGEILQKAFYERGLESDYNVEDVHFYVEMNEVEVVVMFMELKLRVPESDPLYDTIGRLL